MKQIIFYISLTLNFLIVAGASAYVYSETRAYSNEDLARHEAYQLQIETHIKLIEKRIGSPLNSDQKLVINRILDYSQPPYRLPSGLCDAVYSPQGERNVSNQ